MHSFVQMAVRLWLAAIVLSIYAGTAESAQPNIVLIIADDAGYNDFGFMSSLHGIPTDFQTPNLDALASQSVVMSSGYAAAPVCSPSRASLLTGQHSQRFGYEDNVGSTDGLEPGQQLMSHYLKDLGYSTGAIGKWHLGETANVNRPLDMGFDEFFGFFGGGRPYWPYLGADPPRAMRRGNDNIESQWLSQGDSSLYDPVQGRYTTDAFGEEAVDFINRHADDANPFFLYVAMNAPHAPLQAKQQDLALFADIADVNRRNLAAMSYALDRSVGSITDALIANGIDENTIVVFMNDNGGPSVAPYDNSPLHGNKGSLWEGGIRVPMTIRAPGLTPGTYDESVIAQDLLPTLISLAGGDAQQIDTNGTDLLPYLSGDIAGDPHDILFWRSAGGRFAVRKGDWKLVRPGTATFARLHNIADDIDESSYVNSQHPELVQELLRELTFWEATLEKPKWGALGNPRNRFDHFVFRNDLAPSTNWNAADAWKESGTDDNATMIGEDAYANAILEFSTRDDANFTAVNNMRRSTEQTFMLNQLRLTGSFAGAANRVGTINGNELLLVKNLDGANPQLRLDATSSNAQMFTFKIDNDLLLLDDLEITGDGTQSFVIGGDIRDYFEPRSVVKSGTSTVTLNGQNSFGGALVIHDGAVKLSDAAASLTSASVIFIGGTGRLILQDGTIVVDTLVSSSAESVDFRGGRLTAANVVGSLENNGGVFAPGQSPALTGISGNFTLHSGSLEIELGGAMPGTQHDTIAVSGAVQLGGTLEVKLINGFVPALGQEFEFLSASGISGTFDDILLPNLGAAMAWSTRYTNAGVSLRVTVPGDYNGDGVVGAADYSVWRDSLGQTVPMGTGADGNFDGQITRADYSIWKSHYGQAIPLGAGGTSKSSQSIPEPVSIAILISGMLGAGINRWGRC